jgi:exodeoxyribonuclease VII small subunit
LTAKDRELTFEERIEALEKLVASMEEGGMRLDETLAAYEQGMKLAAKLHEELDQAKKKLSVLKDGKVTSLDEQDVSAEV